MIVSFLDVIPKTPQAQAAWDRLDETQRGCLSFEVIATLLISGYGCIEINTRYRQDGRSVLALTMLIKGMLVELAVPTYLDHLMIMTELRTISSSETIDLRDWLQGH